MSAELEHIWSRVQAQLALVVDEPTYRLWLEPLRAVEYDGERVVLEAPEQACRWITERFGGVIHASVELALGQGTLVTISSSAHSTSHTDDPMRDEPARSTAMLPPSHSGPLGNPKLTFEQFVIGDCNRLAHAAALTVAEMPAQAYNPLFIYGPPGVGKTHLLSSIADLLVAHNPSLSVRCATGESFTNAFLGALAGKNVDEFKLRFRDIDVLLMDDIQFLQRKTRTEEEFFHTFNALYDSGRQIVITSDCPPRDLQALEDRLRERFEAGLVADMTPPDLPTRLAILRKRADHDHVELAEDGALELIARRVKTNVRALEGALIRVVAFSSLTSRALTVELAREVLDGLYPTAEVRAPGARTVGDIKAAACKHFGITPEEIVSPSRTARVAWPRQVAMYLARELTDESLPSIGRQFGGRDHTTVMHACKRASARIEQDESSRVAVQKLYDDINSSHHGA